MANERDAFLREIDEQVRREKLAKLWDKYGVAIIGGVAAIILLYAGWKWYQSSQRDAAANAGAQFAEVIQLLADGKKSDAIRGFEQISAEGPHGYAQLARLRLAADARKNGRTGAALQHYEAISANASAHDLIKDFARLQIATLKLDSDDWTTMKNRLDDLLQEDNPWKFAAREILGLAAYKAGKFQEAQEAFTQLLTSGDTPQAMRQRAQIVMALATREIPTLNANKRPADGEQQGDSQEARKTGDGKTQ
ncbi:MAG: tetratricopeptide repeat protein [Pseudomonadota bacterium]